ncbi:MAG: ATP-dependent DNA ligase [Gemmatimonadales bacterium]
MAFADLVAVSDAVAAESSRSGKAALVAGFLAALPTSEIRRAVGMLTGSLPEPLGVGPARLRTAWVQAIEQPSLVAPGADDMTIDAVEKGLRAVAATGGAGSVRNKVALLRGLLERATPEERDFLMRLCFGELRQGALDGVMLDAVVKAFGVEARLVRRAHMLTGDLAETAFVAATEGGAGLARVGLQLLRPLAPMLATPADSLADALARHGTTILEWKIDGARIQAHKSGGEVRVFTRTLRDVTAAVPDVARQVASVGVHDVVLDGEAIALRPDGRPQPFQVTMSRFGASQPGEAPALPLHAFFFDVLHLDGNTLIDVPQRERARILRAAVRDEHLLPTLETAAEDEAEAFLEGALAAGHEGVMAKDPEALYDAGRRGRAWMKVKAARTLDLVVLAVERGSGRRAGWWSNIHLGARDQAGGFVMLGKTFKGMTDETLRWQTETFPPLATRVEGRVMHLRPAIVAEIAFNEIQASPRYPGGLALRFARLERYRPDKTPADADTIDTVRELFEAQTGDAA